MMGMFKKERLWDAFSFLIGLWARNSDRVLCTYENECYDYSSIFGLIDVGNIVLARNQGAYRARKFVYVTPWLSSRTR